MVLTKIAYAALIIIALLALVFTLVLYAHFGFLGIPMGLANDSLEGHTDFDIFWHSVEALWDGRDIYVDTGAWGSNNNPPIFTVLISPFGLLEPLIAYRLFVLIMLLMSAGSLVWMAYELRLPAKWAILGVAMLLLSGPLAGTLQVGQMYPILTLGLVAAWVADRRGKHMTAGFFLGLTVAIKPSLAPVVLWPLVRGQWRMLGTALASGAAATLVGEIVAGSGATLTWLRVLVDQQLDGYWANASLPGAAARLFRENDFAEPIVTLPWMVPAALVLGIGLIIFTAVKVRKSPEMGLWALVAASLLASPVSWGQYFVLLGPGVLLLLARGRVVLALLLLSLQSIHFMWGQPFEYEYTVAATLVLTLNLYILLAHWIAFLTAREGALIRGTSNARRCLRPRHHQYDNGG